MMLKHLRFPDGMRLMDTPVTYKGGLKTLFQRAETASNFGREVGILYTHAHIRHLESLTKLGAVREYYMNSNKLTQLELMILLRYQT